MTPRSGPNTARPEYVYAESREEAQRVLDEAGLNKYRAVPIRPWWRLWRYLTAATPVTRWMWWLTLGGAILNTLHLIAAVAGG